jgi:energy-coupling factor transporter transmembrane protein EcfT
MAYRYIFYLIGTVTEMYTARKARTVDRDSSVKSSRAFVGASAGVLFARTYALSEEVHMAMVSRGYSAGRPTSDRTTVRTTDWALLGVTLLTAVIAIGADRV